MKTREREPVSLSCLFSSKVVLFGVQIHLGSFVGLLAFLQTASEIVPASVLKPPELYPNRFLHETLLTGDFDETSTDSHLCCL
jgi:hypothetical protein